MGIYYVLGWKNPPQNLNSKKSIYNSIHDTKHTTTSMASMNHNFTMYYVSHTCPKSTNPYFPAIHITTDVKSCNGWIQIVHTDTNDPQWQHFIDAPPTCFPFYTLENELYDNPIWNYLLFYKPCSSWIAHSYAVSINHQTKTITCLGGIQWGFKLSYFKLRPCMILPSALEIESWKQDCLIVAQALKDYKIL